MQIMLLVLLLQTLELKIAIANAKKTGIGLVGVKNSGHYGLSSFYAEQAVKKNLTVLCALQMLLQL